MSKTTLTMTTVVARQIAALFGRWGFAVLAFVILGAEASPAVAEDGEAAKQVRINPLMNYQSAIANLKSASDTESFDRQAKDLARLGADQGLTFVEQLLHYHAQNQGDPATSGLVGRALESSRLSKVQIVRAVVTHLENVDPIVVSLTRDWLRGYEDHSVTRPPDFSIYRDLIEEAVRAGRDAPTALVRHMYQSDPGTAFLTMIRGMQLRDPGEIKPLLWGEHVVAELLWKRRYGFVESRAVDPAVTAELEKLSRHSEWWVRLYVVECLNRHPELAAHGMRDRLTTDRDERVRDAAREAVESKSANPARD